MSTQVWTEPTQAVCPPQTVTDLDRPAAVPTEPAVTPVEPAVAPVALTVASVELAVASVGPAVAPVEPALVAAERQVPVPAKPAVPEILSPLDGGVLVVLDELLRNRRRLLRRIQEGRDLNAIARASLITIAVTSALMGLTIGFHRGGIQLLYATLKLPAVTLLTVGLCAPVYTTLKLSFHHRRTNLRADYALLLSSVALAMIVGVSLCPFLVMATFNATPYLHFMVGVLAVCGIGGAVGYLHFFTGAMAQIASRLEKRFIAVALLGTMGLVSSQLSWLLRPWVVVPTDVSTPLFRTIEGSFLHAVSRLIENVIL